MRHLLTLAAAALLPLTSSHALEAVAQQPYWQNGGKNLLSTLKVDAVGTRIVHLSETITEILACNEDGKLFDGTHCVSPGASSLTLNCPDGYYLKGINNNGADCRLLPTGGATPTPVTATISIPTCTTSQTLVSYDGKTLECKDDVSSSEVLGGFYSGWPDAIKCSYTNKGTVILLHDEAMFPYGTYNGKNLGNAHFYHSIGEADSYAGFVAFDAATGKFLTISSRGPNLTGDCSNKSIQDIIKEKRAFKLAVPYQE